MNALLHAALERARQGACVLPLWWTDAAGICGCPRKATCPSPGKHPLTEHGLDDASCDPGKIEDWWRRWPGANVGVRTDAIPRIDIDLVEVAEVLASEPSLLALTEVVRTPRGGLHIALACDGIRTTRLALKDGRKLGDLKAIGGYVLVPPSRIGERAYVLLSPTSVEVAVVQDPTAWLLDKLAPLGHQLADTAASRPYRDTGPHVAEGGRHEAITSHAGVLWVEGIEPAAFRAALRAINDTICAPPLPEDEVDAIALHFVERRERRGKATSLADHDPAMVSTPTRPPPEIPSLDEWLDGEDPPLDVVIGDGAEGAILPIDGKGFIAASTGIGKTNLLLNLGRSLAEGTSFLGRYPVPGPRRVLHLALEGSRRGLRRRLRKVWADSDPDVRLRFHLVQLQLNLMNDGDLDMLDALIRSVGAEVVVIDPLRNAHAWDENSSQEMAQLTAILDAIIARHRCAIIAAHHDRKRPPLAKRDVGTDRIRGSTALSGWLSFCLSIEKSREPDVLIAEWTKVRDAEEGLAELLLAFDREHLSYTATERTAASKVGDDDILTPVYHAGRDGLKKIALVAAVREATSAGERVVQDRIRALVKEQRLLEFIADEDRSRGRKSYRLPEYGEED